MSFPSKEKALALFARINEEISRTDEGRPGIRLEAMRQMVRDESEVVALVVQAYVKAGGKRNLQIAAGLAAAYEVELADDSLTLFVERALADAGTPEALPKFVPGPGGENAVFQLT